jgi:hypothetical protein
MGYTICLDGVGVAYQPDKLEAIDQVHRFADAFPEFKVEIRDEENPHSVYMMALRSEGCDGLLDVAVSWGQRKACANLCDRIADFLGVPHTSVYPDECGEMVTMTVDIARRLFCRAGGEGDLT